MTVAFVGENTMGHGQVSKGKTLFTVYKPLLYMDGAGLFVRSFFFYYCERPGMRFSRRGLAVPAPAFIIYFLRFQGRWNYSANLFLLPILY